MLLQSLGIIDRRKWWLTKLISEFLAAFVIFFYGFVNAKKICATDIIVTVCVSLHDTLALFFESLIRKVK